MDDVIVRPLRTDTLADALDRWVRVDGASSGSAEAPAGPRSARARMV